MEILYDIKVVEVGYHNTEWQIRGEDGSVSGNVSHLITSLVFSTNGSSPTTRKTSHHIKW